MPESQLLSNGAYHLLITPAGGGYSEWHGLGLTRSREDAVLDAWGTFCYLRDEASEAVWSTTLQSTLQSSDQWEHAFKAGRATFRHLDDGIEAHTEIAVSPDADVKLRRVVITNHCERRRTLGATSYAEIVLSPPAVDAAHPAFSKLFIQTEIDPALQAVFATRRPSTPEDPTPWLFHLALIHTADTGTV
jgi:cellobiose phosphorylase